MNGHDGRKMRELLLIGEAQCGKSTTFNAICDGREISPRGGGLKTTGCWISAHPIPADAEEYAELTWKTDDELMLTMYDIVSDNLVDDRDGRSIFPYARPEKLPSLSDERVRALAKKAIRAEWKKYRGNIAGYDAYNTGRLDRLQIATLILEYGTLMLGELRERTRIGIDDVQSFAVFPRDWAVKWQKSGEEAHWRLKDVAFAFLVAATRVPGRHLEIALIGEYQNGKSTIFNAMLDGRDLSPRGVNAKRSACTITACALSRNQKDEYAEFEWRSDTMLDEIVAIGSASDGVGGEDVACLAKLISRFRNAPELAQLRKRRKMPIEEARSFLVYPVDWESRWQQDGNGGAFEFAQIAWVFIGRVKYHVHSTWIDSRTNETRWQKGVKWTAGLSHPDCPNVVSSETLDEWKPLPGYAWVNDKPGDLRVKKIEIEI